MNFRPQILTALLLGSVATVCLSTTSQAAADSLHGIGARSEEETLTRVAGLPSDAELVRSGAVVGDIQVLPQQIFDTTSAQENTALFRAANKLHIRTRVDTIRSQLLFHSGEAYDPRKFAETERLLRQSRYLYDAKIRPIAFHDGKVDVEVVTRDVWTTNPGASFGRTVAPAAPDSSLRN